MLERLQKILAASGAGSRRDCEKMITDGLVAVNGRVVTELGAKADIETDKITLEGKPVRQPERIVLILHKPRGYASTKDDPHAKKIVMDLLPERFRRLNPVGRLDLKSEGLMILTNDGAIANRITHPRYQVPKTYRVTVDGAMDPESLRKLAEGVELEDGFAKPISVDVITLDKKAGRTRLDVVIAEGRNRELRRLFEAVGFEVIRLIRTRIGPIALGKLPSGKYRELYPDEALSLRQLMGEGRPRRSERKRD